MDYTHSIIEKCFFSSVVIPSFRWLVCQGTAVWQPPNTLFNYFGQIQGQAPKTPKKPPLYATRALTRGCSFCPYGGRNAVRKTHRSFLLLGLYFYILVVQHGYECWLQSVVLEETVINQQLEAFFPKEQLRLYQTTTPFPVAWLTSQEQAFFETLTHPKRQASWLLGRTVLKFLACQQSGLVPHGVQNPMDTLEAWQFPHPRCSVSHTEQVAYALVNLNLKTSGFIGLDVEGMSRKPLSLKALGYLLSEAERMDLERLQWKNPEERWDLRYWTTKEALYKATPAEHQGNIQLNSWQVEILKNEGMNEAHVQTKTGELLTGRVFNTITPCLQSRRLISVALV